jgi:SAM-dependent methyltransferase
MHLKMKLSEPTQKSLRCPVCYAKVKNVDQEFVCINSVCDTHFPIVDGIPVLLNEKSSLFAIGDFVTFRPTFFSNRSKNKLKTALLHLIPSISKNIRAKKNYRLLGELLLRQSTSPRVLVIGGSIRGYGMESIANNASIEFIESDISFGQRTMVIIDAHDIPFEDKSFDGVIVQAVLEHVIDPYRCADEIHRVLKEQGIVYAETPFIQQVHGKQYDFTRFTHIGHRRLFRRFEEISSGAGCGPGMALAWSYQYFLLSFTTSRMLRSLVTVFANLTSFYLKYFDYYLIDKPGALDAAAGYYFMGRKTKNVLSDRELIQLYKGAN